MLALSAVACGGGAPSGAPGAAGGGRGGRGDMPPMPVDMVTLEAKPVEQAGDFVATVKSRRSTTIQPQAEGFLTRIAVASGDRVTPGATLFEIDAAAQQAGAASLASVRAARDADAVFARQRAQRAKQLLEVGAGSQQEYEQALAQQKAADAQLKAIDDQIRQQQAELAYFRVTAPAAGVIGDVPVRVGDRVTKSTALTTIEDNTALELYISVPVQEAAKLRVGLPVRVLSDTNETVTASSVSFVSPSVEEGTQTVLAKATLESRAGAFRTDQLVRARIIWTTAPGLTIPVVSVNRINGQYFAFVAEPAGGGFVARQRAVMLGPVVGADYVVVSGLNAGDRLIVGGIQKIGDGAPVQAAPPPGAGRPGGPGAPGAGAGRGGQ